MPGASTARMLHRRGLASDHEATPRWPRKRSTATRRSGCRDMRCWRAPCATDGRQDVVRRRLAQPVCARVLGKVRRTELRERAPPTPNLRGGSRIGITTSCSDLSEHTKNTTGRPLSTATPPRPHHMTTRPNQCRCRFLPQRTPITRWHADTPRVQACTTAVTSMVTDSRGQATTAAWSESRRWPRDLKNQ